jgi:toxin ParE1/3/4
MGAKPLEIHPVALADFKAAVVWYVDKSESAAVNFVAEIDNAIKLITASPQRWPAAERGTRRFVLRRYPYAVIYRERDSDIQVLAIAHGIAVQGIGRNGFEIQPCSSRSAVAHS